MRVFYHPDQALHRPRTEIFGGEMIVPFERPSRSDQILDALKDHGPAIHPGPCDPGRLSVHDAGYLRFLQTCWKDWQAAGFKGEAHPTAMPLPSGIAAKEPIHIEGRIGFYAASGESAIMAGTWDAVTASAASAQAAADAVAAGGTAAFALCRPPGHHAMHARFGGYCYINNAAVAVEILRQSGAARVALLDIDFHHGNGSQDIFYDRGDVFFASIHGTPAEAYPFFVGHSDERGTGDGEGANLNLPLPPGTSFDVWADAFGHAVRQIKDFGAEALVISLGVDACQDDPQSFFRVAAGDFSRIGQWIAAIGLPSVFVMEGGYGGGDLGGHVARVLDGFEAG